MKPTIRKVSLSEVMPQIQSVNPEFAAILCNLNPSKEYNLYEATYPYGYRSVRSGKFYMPNAKGEVVPLTDSSIDEKIREDLSYNLGANPVTLVLEKVLEIYLKLDCHTIPLAFVPEGALISTGVVLNPQHNYQPAFLWNVHAGARSIFTLAKLSVTDKFEQLKQHFNVSSIPLDFADHGNLFQEIANSPEFGERWTTKVLYFGKKWFERLNDLAWRDFTLYLYRTSWQGTSYWRYEFVYDLVFSLIKRRQNLKPDPFLADTVEHILVISMGACPGFAPALNDKVAPINRIEKIISDVYKLDKYAPIIMVPTYFSMHDKSRPVYYSLGYPITFNFSPKARKLATKRSDLGNVRHILNKYLKEMKADELNLKLALISQVPNFVKYDYFHSKPLLTEGIRDSKDIFLEDQAFIECAKKSKNKLFPHTSPFLRGCVRISNAT